ncbi:glycosyltransferase family 9 protein [Mesorhizobium sp. M1163]|uniref:glycosyltransferase family 9 protein n=1 Tax=Mesorhizobium sp. M1163 TaxID=2957065 RepID=UPI003337E12E
MRRAIGGAGCKELLRISVGIHQHLSLPICNQNVRVTAPNPDIISAQFPAPNPPRCQKQVLQNPPTHVRSIPPDEFIGDLVLASALASYLRLQYPRARIVFLCEADFCRYLMGRGVASDVVAFRRVRIRCTPVQRGRELYALARAPRRLQFALAIDEISRQTALDFPLVGGLDERTSAERIVAKAASPVVNVAGAMSLATLLAVLGQARLFLGNESGPSTWPPPRERRLSVSSA